MRALFWVPMAALVAGCGAMTGTDSGPPGVPSSMILTNARINFTVGEAYTFADYWKASDAYGTELPLDSIGLRYSLGDSLPAHSLPVSPAGSVNLSEPFIGFLYVFAHTTVPVERMGQHYINVAP